MIRPEVRDLLLRWREAAIGLLILIVSVQISVMSFGIRRWLGVFGVLIGAALLFEGVRRARLPHGRGGPGVVEVDERRITYFGPLGGGAVSVDDLSRVAIRKANRGPRVSNTFWDLTTTDGTTLTIPSDAEGASALFDALAPLKGVDYEAAIRAASATDADLFVVWESGVRRLH